ncbi:MAG: hypothetical protein ACT4P5_20825 [Armatimonadota bacterium]
MRRTLAVAVLLILGPSLTPVKGAPAGCLIAEGKGIGGVQVGMAVAAALSATGAPVRQQAAGSQVVYSLRAPWTQMIVDGGVVQRISARGSACRTARGVGPGSTLGQVRAAYTSEPVSSITPVENGDLLSYLFAGVAFLIRRDRVESVEVFTAQGLAPAGGTAPAAGPAAPQPTPTRPGASPGPSPSPTTSAGTWGVPSSTTRVEDGTFVVSGTVENRDRPLAVFADVRLFASGARQIGRGDAPVQPNPVRVGGTATFEVRVPIDEVVVRYVVTIRPANSPLTSLAERAWDVRDLQQFAAMVRRVLRVAVQTTNPTPAPNTFVVAVSNGSQLSVASVGVAVEIGVTCRVASGQIIQETWTGSATVQGIGPNGSSQAPVSLSGGVCLFFATWSPTARITDVRLSQ